MNVNYEMKSENSLILYKKKKRAHTVKLMKKNSALYVFLIPAVVYLLIFAYAPMYGVQIAFRDYTFANGILGSKWVGMKWFELFFNSPLFLRVISNTIIISLYSLIAGFPIPIFLAILLNNIPSLKFKRLVQTASYLPHFISVVVIVGMLSSFLSMDSGFLSKLIESIGVKPAYYMGQPGYFRHLYVWSGVWQGAGWGSIIYLAALTSVSPELHEAAMIDGASRIRRIWHIDIPSILPTMVIMLILRSGSIMSVGFEKVYLMQNDLVLSVGEVISTYTYKMGIIGQKYSYSSAIGLFNNIINFVFLTIVNNISRKLTDTSLW